MGAIIDPTHSVHLVIKDRQTLSVSSASQVSQSLLPFLAPGVACDPKQPFQKCLHFTSGKTEQTCVSGFMQSHQIAREALWWCQVIALSLSSRHVMNSFDTTQNSEAPRRQKLYLRGKVRRGTFACYVWKCSHLYGIPAECLPITGRFTDDFFCYQTPFLLEDDRNIQLSIANECSFLALQSIRPCVFLVKSQG